MQNITRDSEIKNKLTVTRGEVGGNNRGEGISGTNKYKGHMDKTDKTKEWWNQRREMGMVGVGREVVGGNADNYT